MPKVRTTMRPHEEIEVSETEYRDLVRQGLIPEPAIKPARSRTTDSKE